MIATNTYWTRLGLLLLITQDVLQYVSSFAGKGNNPSLAAFDRFSAKCPADIDSVRQFGTRFVKEFDSQNKEVIWVTVFRSNNNLPSVIREDFFSAMQIATNIEESSTQPSTQFTDKIESYGGNQTPVAVARLRPLDAQQNSGWIMDCMQCSLKKETQDPNCDGGSEHTEALGVCVDELIKHHLSIRRDIQFAGSIKCKATLVSAKVLEARGFGEFDTLGKDMISHVSSSDALIKYSERLCDVQGVCANNPQIRDRTLQIISLLGKSDNDKEEGNTGEEINEADDDYDPWASVKKFY